MAVLLAQRVLGFGATKACGGTITSGRVALRTLNGELIGRITVISTIGEKIVDATIHLIQKTGQHGHITDILFHQIGGHIVAVVRIDPKMQLSPRLAGLAPAFLSPQRS